uniref:ATP synthase subunit a n=1 Tax=Sminthurus viridis TaxID=109609 RepID=B2BS90_SMIVR|nr:ATP synthase F0 subunit 6 [Sminthurus viridis]ABS82046.1 ATP synthase F0 subunit 6 [Sminthurus viridis]
MMTNLFSIFDPSTSMGTSLNWSSMFIILLMLFPCYWAIPSNINMFFSNIVSVLHKEIKITLGKTTPLGTSLFLISILIFIMHNNVMGLLPYIFTASSHMTMTLTLALPFWMSLMLFGWINSAVNMLAHLVPQGTPAMLMMFMVLIETISNMIRPLTLAVRLTANMIAGHLLMTLIGNQAAVSSMITLLGVMNAFILLTILEMAVAFIQAYVFAVLLTLYVNEIHH